MITPGHLQNQADPFNPELYPDARHLDIYIEISQNGFEKRKPNNSKTLLDCYPENLSNGDHWFRASITGLLGLEERRPVLDAQVVVSREPKGTDGDVSIKALTGAVPP